MAVFSSKCCHMYGCEAWNLNPKYVNGFWKAWNRCVRILLKLHPRTHCRLLPLIAGSENAADQMMNRFLVQVKTMANSPSRRILYMTMSSLNDCSSIIGHNMSLVCANYDIPRERIFSVKLSAHTKMYTPEERADAMAIQELRLMLSHPSDNDVFNANEAKQFIDFICTN